MNSKRPAIALALTLAAMSLALSSAAAAAAEKGDWIARAAATTMDPETDSDTLNGISRSGLRFDSDSASASIAIARMITQHFAVELAATLPFSAELDGNDRLQSLGIPHLADTDILPVTLGAQYHVATGSAWHPYVGVGATYVRFADEKDRANGIRVDLQDATGPSAQLGVDIGLSDRWLLNVDARYVDVDTTAKLRGMIDQDVDVTFTPWLFSVGVGYVF